MRDVAGKRILITGAAMGMGRMYAQLAVREGAAAVVLWDINEPALAHTAQELRDAGGTVFTDVVDVADTEQVQRHCARVLAEVGDIHVLFNNAGIVVGRLFAEHSDAQITKTMAINAIAPMSIARCLLAPMLRSAEECRIVNIASAAGLVANPRMSVYCASKWALVGWSDSLRLELQLQGTHHVRVTTVCPSYVSTGMFQGAKAPLLTPILSPEYVTERVWRAMKHGTPFLRLPWTVSLVGLMRGLLPRTLFDWLVGSVFGVYHSMENFRGRGGS